MNNLLDQYRQSILEKLCIVIFGVTFPFIIISYLDYNYLNHTTISLVLLCLMSIISYLINKKGYVSSAAILFVLCQLFTIQLSFLVRVIEDSSYTRSNAAFLIIPIVISGITIRSYVMPIFGFLPSISIMLLYIYKPSITNASNILSNYISLLVFSLVMMFIFRPIENIITKQEETIHKKTEELSLALRRAESLNQHKARFLANMSHELRTPLASIIGFAGLLKSPKAEPLTLKQKMRVEDIINSSSHLLFLITNILEHAKIDAGKIDIKPSKNSIKSEIIRACHTISHQASDKSLQIKYSIPEDVPDIWFDSNIIQQVLLNLLSNAIKFSNSGDIIISTSYVNNEVIVMVQDTGIGIAEEDHQKIFEEYGRSHEALGIEGTGLGLAICKHLIELHGGRIWVESSIGIGSTFSFSLPTTKYK